MKSSRWLVAFFLSLVLFVCNVVTLFKYPPQSTEANYICFGIALSVLLAIFFGNRFIVEKH